MAFRYNEIGQLLATDPKAARAKLGILFVENNYMFNQTARALGVDRTTLRRWCAKLKDLGLGDPRCGQGKAGKTVSTPPPEDPLAPPPE